MSRRKWFAPAPGATTTQRKPPDSRAVTGLRAIATPLSLACCDKPPALVHGKVHGIGRLARGTATAVYAARARSTGVGYGNRYGGGGRDGRRWNRGRKLVSSHPGRGLFCAVPVDNSSSGKIAAVDCQRELGIARVRGVRYKLRDGRHDSRLRRHGLGGAVSASQATYREQQHRNCLHDFLQSESSNGEVSKGQRGRCQAGVIFLSRKCLWVSVQGMPAAIPAFTQPGARI